MSKMKRKLTLIYKDDLIVSRGLGVGTLETQVVRMFTKRSSGYSTNHISISRNERSNDAKQLLRFVHFRDISVYHPIDNEWESFIFCYIQLPKCATSGSLSISLYGMYETNFKMVFRILSLELRVRQGYQNI